MTDAPRILVCDDEPALRELMRAVLEPAYEVAEAVDAATALAACRELRPDAVLLDVMLPGASGIEVLHELRADPALAATPVAIVSAWDTEADRRAAEAEGVDAFVSKPFLPEELVAVVERLLGAA